MPQINQLPNVSTPAASDLFVGQQASGVNANYTPAQVAAAQGLKGAAYLAAGGANGAAVLDGSGNVSANTVLATGATTARALSAMSADQINVANYGALLNGSTSDSAAFQAAYNATPTDGIIDIPIGGLSASVTETVGKSVLWRTMGTLDYGTSAPGTNPVVGFGSGDVFETFLGGRKRFSKTATNTGSYAVVEVDLTNNYSSGSLGGVSSGLIVSATQNAAAPTLGVWAIDATTTLTSSGADNIGISASLLINTAGAGAGISLYSQVLDNHGDAGGISACEFDIYTVAADPIGTGGPGAGKRAIGVCNVGLQGTPAVVPEVSRGLEIGSNGTANIGAAFQASARLYYAAFDCSQATFLTTDSTGNAVKVAAYSMAPGMPIDFTRNPATSTFNQHTLSYSSSALQYQVGGAAVLSVADTGAVTASGPVISASNGSTPASGATVTVPNSVQRYFIRGSATLASLTIDLPTAPINAQDLVLIFECAVTALTITPPAGYTVNLPVSGSSVAAGSRVLLTLDGTVWV